MASERRRPAREWLFAVALVLFALLQAEILARAYLAVFRDVPFVRPGAAFERYYPELEAVRSRPGAPDPGTLDLLLLGGSVLDRRWTGIEERLQERLAAETGRPVRLYNVSFKAHTSRDSLLKYRRVGERRFDAVVFYHGINEARANNAPDEVFEADYGHYAWYREVNALAEDPLGGHLALPFVLRLAGFALTDLLGLTPTLPPHEPRREWVRHGAKVKTQASFRDNLAAILELAHARGEPVVAMTFALQVRPEFTRAGFRRRGVDQRKDIVPIEAWGLPQHVRAAVDAHNEALREQARGRPGVFLVDQAERLDGDRRAFRDVCHLTEYGAARFVDNMLPATLEALAWTPPPATAGAAGH